MTTDAQLMRSFTDQQERDLIAEMERIRAARIARNLEAVKEVSKTASADLEAAMDLVRDQILADGRGDRLKVRFVPTLPDAVQYVPPRDVHDDDRIPAAIFVKIRADGDTSPPRAYALLDVSREVFNYLPDGVDRNRFVK